MSIRIHKCQHRPILADSRVAYAMDLSLGAKGLMLLVENEPEDFSVIPEKISEQYPCNSAEEIQGFIDELVTFGYLQVR